MTEYMLLSEAAANICATEAEFLAMVERGELPDPVVRNGERLWDWLKVDAAMTDGSDHDDRRVYFIEAGGLIKIGFTTNIKKRFSAITSLIPLKGTILLLHIRGSRSREIALHRKFKHLREHGEWFRKEPELLELIDKLRNEQRTKEDRLRGGPLT